MKTYAFRFWGYNVVWIVLAGFLFWMIRRIGAARRRVDTLERELRRREEESRA